MKMNKSKLQNWLELGLIIILVVVLSLSALSAANPINNAPGRDGGFFNYVGKAIKSGASLYSDIWDSKGPMIFWINALGMGRDFSRVGVYFIEVIFWAVSLFIAYLFARKQYGLLPAFGTIIAGHFLFSAVIGPGNATEEYSVIFTWIAIGALALFISKPQSTFLPFFLMGAGIITTFLFRANNIGTQLMTIIVALIFAIVNRKTIKIWQAFLYLFIGIASVLLPVVIYFSSQGTLKAMIDASIFYNFHYSMSRGNPFSNIITPAFRVFNSWTLVFIAIWLYASVKLIKEFRNKRFDAFLLLLVLSFPVEAFMSSISGRGFQHYFICWVPACMLLFSYAFSMIDKEVLSKDFSLTMQTKFSSLLIPTVLVFAIISSYSGIYQNARLLHSIVRSDKSHMEFSEPIAKLVNNLTSEDDKVLVFGGQAGINVMAKRDSINTAIFYPNINDSEIGLGIQSHFFDTLKNERPMIILDGYKLIPQQLPAIDPKDRANQQLLYQPAKNTDQVLDWIYEHYEKVDEADDYIIYMLKD